MTDGVTFILPQKLENIICYTMEILTEEKNLGNPFIPSFPMWYVHSGYMEQMVAKYWIELVKDQRRMKRTSAYDLTEDVLAKNFIDYLMDQTVPNQTLKTVDHLARVNTPGNVSVTADMHHLRASPDKPKLPVRTVKSDCTMNFSAGVQRDNSRSRHERKPRYTIIRTPTGPETKLDIEIISEHKTVHKSVQKLGRAQRKQARKAGKRWSIIRLLKTLCPCIGSHKSKITDEYAQTRCPRAELPRYIY